MSIRLHYALVFHVLSLLLLYMTIGVQCDDIQTDFIISEEVKTERFESLIRTYRVPIITKVTDNLIFVKVFQIDSSNPIFVFISNNIDEVTNDKSAYKSFAYKPFIFIPST